MKRMTKNISGYAYKKRKKDNISAYLFLAPALILFSVFVILPTLICLILCFFKYNLITPPQFVGLDNIRKLFSDRAVKVVAINTLKFLLILCPIYCILGMLLAYAVYRARRFQYFFRSVIYFPCMVTTATVAIVWGYLFSTDLGAVNWFVRLLGGANIPWLSDKVMVYVTLALFGFWKSIGGAFLYYFIGMQNIPDTYYDAAQIDGASVVQSFRYVTLPLLSPTIFFVVITTIIGVSQIFDEPWLITGSGPGNATRTIGVMIYQTAFQDLNLGYGGALSFALFLIILVVTIIQYIGQKRWVVYDYE